MTPNTIFLLHSIFTIHITHPSINRHIGIRVRGALIASIYNKALSVDLSASKESIGKINNLISVDVGVRRSFFILSFILLN